MRIVLDSNVLIRAIGKNSNFRPIWTAFLSGQYQLILSDEVVYEYEEIIQLNSAPGASKIVMEVLIESQNVINQQIYYSWNAIKKDPDDNKFFDLAIAGNADYLITNDAHFNVVKKLTFPKVRIISAEEFLNILSNL
jgi:putative PIN family toxin of toxin-antitoxin system